MKYSERQRIAMTQLNYPPGTRIVLNHIEDPYDPVPPCTRGTVRLVDDAGQIHPEWDNGRNLAVIPGIDSFRKLTAQELVWEQQQAQYKPNCPLTGQNGNIFNLMGIASQTLRQYGQGNQAKEMQHRVMECGSYTEAMNVIGEYHLW